MDTTYLFYFLWIFFIASAVITVAGFFRARAKAKAASGTRLFIRTSFFIIIFLGIVMTVTTVIAFGKEALYRQKAQKAERIINTGRAELFQQYMENDKGKEITDPEGYLKSYIKLNNQRALDARFGGVNALFATVYLLTLSLSEIWFFTDEGLIIYRWKEFESVTAARREGEIDIFYKAKLVNDKKLLTVKNTPKNLALFGRYIEYDNEDSEVTVSADSTENGT